MMNVSRLKHILIACILLVWTAGCSTSEQPRIELKPCSVSNMLAKCGKLSVYENRATNQGRKIDIHVAVIAARSKPIEPDPIFYIAGGPGGSAIDDAPYALLVLKAATEHRDLVLVDQRGTGRSNKLTCPKTFAQSVGGVPLDQKAIEDLHTCIITRDDDPTAYTTAWGMDDLDDVRAALGYDKINLYGESYGPTAAQVYLSRHGRHVRTMALEGVTLTDVPMFTLAPMNTQKALDKLLARCQADDACQSAYPNLEEEFYALLDSIDAHPVPLPLTYPDSGSPVVMTRAMMVAGIFGMLGRTEEAVMLPALVHQAYQGNWDVIAEALAPALSRNAPAPYWQLMNLNILCHEDWARMPHAETEQMAAQSFMRYEEARSLVVPEAVCTLMPAPPPEALYQPIKRSNVPVLLISNGADPWNPPENVAGAKERYPNSLTLVAPGQGHGYTGIPCRERILADFFERGSVEGLDAACLEAVPLPAFVTGQ